MGRTLPHQPMPSEEDQPDLRHRHQDQDRHYRRDAAGDFERRLLPPVQSEESSSRRRRNLRAEEGLLRRLRTAQEGPGGGRPSAARRSQAESGEEAALSILGLLLLHPQRNVPSQNEFLEINTKNCRHFLPRQPRKRVEPNMS